MENKEYTITGYDEINGIKVNDLIFNDELIEYQIRDREDFINHLIEWISVTLNDNDKELMKEDLKYLITLEDDYILNSISTNEYLSKSDTPHLFNEVCKDILSLNDELSK